MDENTEYDFPLHSPSKFRAARHSESNEEESSATEQHKIDKSENKSDSPPVVPKLKCHRKRNEKKSHTNVTDQEKKDEIENEAAYTFESKSYHPPSPKSKIDFDVLRDKHQTEYNNTEDESVSKVVKSKTNQPQADNNIEDESEIPQKKLKSKKCRIKKKRNKSLSVAHQEHMDDCTKTKTVSAQSKIESHKCDTKREGKTQPATEQHQMDDNTDEKLMQASHKDKYKISKRHSRKKIKKHPSSIEKHLADDSTNNDVSVSRTSHDKSTGSERRDKKLNDDNIGCDGNYNHISANDHDSNGSEESSKSISPIRRSSRPKYREQDDIGDQVSDDDDNKKYYNDEDANDDDNDDSHYVEGIRNKSSSVAYKEHMDDCTKSKNLSAQRKMKYQKCDTKRKGKRQPATEQHHMNDNTEEESIPASYRVKSRDSKRHFRKKDKKHQTSTEKILADDSTDDVSVSRTGHYKSIGSNCRDKKHNDNNVRCDGNYNYLSVNEHDSIGPEESSESISPVIRSARPKYSKQDDDADQVPGNDVVLSYKLMKYAEEQPPLSGAMQPGKKLLQNASNSDSDEESYNDEDANDGDNDESHNVEGIRNKSSSVAYQEYMDDCTKSKNLSAQSKIESHKCDTKRKGKRQPATEQHQMDDNTEEESIPASYKVNSKNSKHHSRKKDKKHQTSTEKHLLDDSTDDLSVSRTGHYKSIDSNCRDKKHNDNSIGSDGKYNYLSVNEHDSIGSEEPSESISPMRQSALPTYSKQDDDADQVPGNDAVLPYKSMKYAEEQPPLCGTMHPGKRLLHDASNSYSDEESYNDEDANDNDNNESHNVEEISGGKVKGKTVKKRSTKQKGNNSSQCAKNCSKKNFLPHHNSKQQLIIEESSAVNANDHHINEEQSFTKRKWRWKQADLIQEGETEVDGMYICAETKAGPANKKMRTQSHYDKQFNQHNKSQKQNDDMPDDFNNNHYGTNMYLNSSNRSGCGHVVPTANVRGVVCLNTTLATGNGHCIREDYSFGGGHKAPERTFHPAIHYHNSYSPDSHKKSQFFVQEGGVWHKYNYPSDIRHGGQESLVISRGGFRFFGGHFYCAENPNFYTSISEQQAYWTCHRNV